MTNALADWRSGFPSAVACALLGAGAAWALTGEILAAGFLAGTMGAIAVEDLRRMRVPDAWNLPAAIGGFAAVAWEARAMGVAPLAALGHAALSLIVCGGVFYLLREIFFRWRGAEGLGLGDVKLAATGGVWLGWENFPAVVTLAALSAIAWVAAISLAHKGWPRERKIPFGAFLAPAIWVCWIYARAGLG